MVQHKHYQGVHHCGAVMDPLYFKMMNVQQINLL